MQVTAIRDGVKRVFSLGIWTTFPANKYGWKLAAETPQEVAALKAKPEPVQLAPDTSAEDYAESLSAARKAVAEADEAYAQALAGGKKNTIAKALKAKEAAEEELKALLHAEAAE